MMGWNDRAGWVGWVLLMNVGIIAFWTLVVLAMMTLLPGVRDDGAERNRRPEPDDALRVLDERLACGEERR